MSIKENCFEVCHAPFLKKKAYLSKNISYVFKTVEMWFNLINVFLIETLLCNTCAIIFHKQIHL